MDLHNLAVEDPQKQDALEIMQDMYDESTGQPMDVSVGRQMLQYRHGRLDTTGRRIGSKSTG
jgi:hypothetical protein